MTSKLRLYLSTASHLKPSQIAARLWRRLGGKTPLKWGFTPQPDIALASIDNIAVLPQLDFDLHFIERFDVEAILENCITLLHRSEMVDWSESWHKGLSTPLWRFNLHYCEYLLPLAYAFFKCGDECYLVKGKQIIEAWIDCCPQEKGGVAWDPYTVALRVVNWLAFCGELREYVESDAIFFEKMNSSLAEQQVFLATHLETDLLANHYLEELKSIVLLSCYFNDNETLRVALPKLLAEVDAQVLPDGMHFELSPMYHKVILESLLRVAATVLLRDPDMDAVREFRLQDMCDCLYSLERGISRTPLFNDAGDNVSKSRDALLNCAASTFGIKPVFRSVLPDAGYVILERNADIGVVKVIFDAGKPGPTYAMGHAHCDALSFECFIDGKPWIVNGGTYCYQGDERLECKRTLSHSTVMVDGEEQHECWAPFRVARFGVAALVECGGDYAIGEFVARDGHAKVKRIVRLEADKIVIRDECDSPHLLTSCFIFPDEKTAPVKTNGTVQYAPEFGEASLAQRALLGETNTGFLEAALDFPAAEKKQASMEGQ